MSATSRRPIALLSDIHSNLEALEKVLADNPGEYSVAKLVDKEVVPAVQAIIESKLADFNSAGKAIS